MKTNFLRAKSPREQFHLIRHSAALIYKAAHSEGLSEVSATELVLHLKAPALKVHCELRS